jgi:hypothetical protein
MEYKRQIHSMIDTLDDEKEIIFLKQIYTIIIRHIRKKED